MSSSGRGKINLTALVHSIVKTAKGTEVLVIPIAQNNLYKSEKGNVYLDIIYNEKKTVDESGNTHIINQSVPKEVREALKAENKYPPTLGNLQHWNGYQEQAPSTQVSVPEDTAIDDLPF